MFCSQKLYLFGICSHIEEIKSFIIWSITSLMVTAYKRLLDSRTYLIRMKYEQSTIVHKNKILIHR